MDFDDQQAVLLLGILGAAHKSGDLTDDEFRWSLHFLIRSTRSVSLRRVLKQHAGDLEERGRTLQ